MTTDITELTPESARESGSILIIVAARMARREFFTPLHALCESGKRVVSTRTLCDAVERAEEHMVSQVSKIVDGHDRLTKKLKDAESRNAELVEALEKAQQQIIELQQGCENDPRIHEIIDLKESIDNLESFRTAYMEWGEKTDWVQTDKRFDVLKPWGKHRADVLKEYIQHLEPRAVTVKLPRPGFITISGEHMAVYMKGEVVAALLAAGIKWEAE